ncbi:MAG: competence/damage-inducible protein A [Candidatus Methylacidiphilales bacterium]|nr:competence/damage-inducible protein A [Candidatus Methylacidiphilales bacterium]
MNLEVLNTGSELLLGQVTNTHTGYFGRQLASLGLRLARQTSVPDGEPIRTALAECLTRADIVLVTGGLGPTSDDLTRDLVAAHFGLALDHHPDIESTILAYFQKRGIQAPDSVRVQAQVPRGAAILANHHGTAPGFHLHHAGRHVFCLPGPPRELYPMFENEVLPRLHSLLPDARPLCMQTLRVHGMGESRVQELVEAPILALGQIEIGYCARPGEVDLRLIAPDEPLLQAAVACASALLAESIYATDDETLESRVISLAREKNVFLATAESCTGGFTAHRLTNVPGASAVLDRGWVTYSNESKTDLLGVPAGLLATHGAVSAPVAEAMARGALERSRATLAVSLTGIAGPDPGTKEKPAGLVFIGLAVKSRQGISVQCQQKRLVPERETFKTMASQAALDLVRRALLNL